ncbi:MAG: hypothetical protein ABI333_28015 [bacterium]
MTIDARANQTRQPPAVLLLLFVMGTAALGCSQRSVGSGNTNSGPDGGQSVGCQDLWDCNPGVTCGELVMCEAGRCAPELGHAIIPCTIDECTTDGDCVVAHGMNCCWGCPQVMSRQALENLECFYEEGHPPDTIPVECEMDCFYCEDCNPVPLGARCDAGQCVPTDLGCPTFSAPPPPTVTTLQLVQNAAAHEGELRLIRGAVIPGEGSCDGEGCSASYDSMLNGVVRLDGYLCELTVDLVGDECRANLTSYGVQAGGWYELEGIVHEPPDPWRAPWLEVTASRIVEPEDLGGRYEGVITAIESNASDPTCVPPPWTVGDPVDVFLARSGPQIRVAAPDFHCEANFSGGFDDVDGGPFTTSLPIDCLDCDYSVSGAVTENLLEGHYHILEGSCEHTLYFEGWRYST